MVPASLWDMESCSREDEQSPVLFTYVASEPWLAVEAGRVSAGAVRASISISSRIDSLSSGRKYIETASLRMPNAVSLRRLDFKVPDPDVKEKGLS